MNQARWAGLFLAVLPFLAGCGDFWQAPSGTGTTSFSLLSSPTSITVSAGATSGNTSTITVTPSNSFTGTVDLSCTVTAPTGATNPPTCNLSPTSLDITGTSAMTATLTATAASTTTSGAYTITVSGSSSGSTTETTSVCAVVGTSSSTCTSTANTSGIFYVLSGTSIAGYTINSGSLAGVSGTSFTNLSGASAIAIAPNGTFLFVASEGIGIIPYTVNTSTGALTQGNAFGDSVAGALQIDPSGKWLIDASLGGSLLAYPITSTGALANQTLPQPVALASISVEQMAISPNGTLISVALGGTGTQSFPFNAGNSTTPIGTAYNPLSAPYGNGGAALSVAFDPQSRFLYVGETAAFNSATNSGALRVFTVGTNSLAELKYSAGSPYAPLGTGPHSILPDPTGSYVYAASWQSGAAGSITGYTVAATALTQIGSSTFATGTQPIGLAEDSTEGYVLAISSTGTPSFNAYTFDSTTLGQLDPISVTGSPSADPPVAIVAIPKQ
jgi:6-phosphogluconolactonase (cycloisomerase 2 family)